MKYGMTNIQTFSDATAAALALPVGLVIRNKFFSYEENLALILSGTGHILICFFTAHRERFYRKTIRRDGERKIVVIYTIRKKRQLFCIRYVFCFLLFVQQSLLILNVFLM